MAPENKRKRKEDVPAPKSKPAPKSAPETSNKRVKSEAKLPASNTNLAIASTLKNSKNEESSFPRGGASALTPLEYKEVANEAMKDALFEAGGAAAANTALLEGEKTKRKPRRDNKKGGKKGAEKEKKETGPKVEGLSWKVGFLPERERDSWDGADAVLRAEIGARNPRTGLHRENQQHGYCAFASKQLDGLHPNYPDLGEGHQADRSHG